jgi:hypothetical protein
VLASGRVAGVVFAASTTDAGIGYAITSTEAQSDISRGVGARLRVSTGACTR